MQKYFILGLCFYFLPYFFYLAVSHGLGHKAEYLQLRRFIPCALLAVLPLYLFSIEPTYPPYLLSIIIGAAWIITYPLLYFLTKLTAELCEDPTTCSSSSCGQGIKILKSTKSRSGE